MMVVTINTDASFHPQEKFGGFAFTIVCNDGRIKKAGALRKKAIDPTDAEIRSIGNALHTLLEQNFKDVYLVVINTDCTNAIEGIRGHGKYSHLSKNFASAKAVRKLLEQVKTKYNKLRLIDFRHVKAHTGNIEKRSLVNEWCDTEAKMWMWRKVNEEKQKQQNERNQKRRNQVVDI